MTKDDSENKLSIIIPAYNEEEGIRNVVTGIMELYPYFEIIVIDDGSTDGTFSKIEDLSVKIIRHETNRGYGASIKTGIRAAIHEWIAIMDADGQHDPEDIGKLILSREGYDMVVGVRDKRSHKPFWRRPGKKLINWVVDSLSGTHIPDINSGLRLFSKELALKQSHLYPNGFSLTTTMTVAFFREGYNIKYTPIVVKKRLGKSSVNIFDGFRALLLIVRLFMIFSPLRIFLPSSLVLLGFGGYLLINDLLAENIQDITILIILTGLLIFFFGLIVDQMAHIRREMRK